MKVIVSALAVALLLGVGAAALLNAEQKNAYEAFTTSGARVGDPGRNLVGPQWNGRAG
jgi:hypothetical protein